MLDSIKNHPIASGVLAVIFFTLVTFPAWLGTVWPAFVKDKTVPQWLGEHWPQQWALSLFSWLILAVVIALVLWAVVVVITKASAKPNPLLPNGPTTWKLMRKIVNIPDARAAKLPQSWTEGLGHWDSFAFHNLSANKPLTRGTSNCGVSSSTSGPVTLRTG